MDGHLVRLEIIYMEIVRNTDHHQTTHLYSTNQTPNLKAQKTQVLGHITLGLVPATVLLYYAISEALNVVIEGHVSDPTRVLHNLCASRTLN
jgi:hypothetical protein